MRARVRYTVRMLALLVVVALALALAVHEAGHACAAWALGARDVRVRLGWPALTTEATLATPARRALFLVAGPLANALVAVAVAAGMLAGAGGGGAAAVVVAANAVVGLACALGSDGREALRHVRSRGEGMTIDRGRVTPIS